jgi:hypothetical protein
MPSGILPCKSSPHTRGFVLLPIILLLALPAMGQWGDQVERVSESLISGSYHDLDIYEDYAFAAMGYGLAVFDVSDSSQIRALSFLGTPGQAEGLCLEGDYLYLASGSGGLQIVNVFDPASPACAADLHLPGYAYEAVKSGNVLYVAAGSAGLRVIDVSLPDDPQEVASLSLGGWVLDLSLEDTLLYVAAQSSGLKVVSVANPTQPHTIGEYNTAGIAQGVKKVGNLVYVADGPGGLEILNVADPTAPTHVGQWPTTSSLHELEIYDNYAYAANDDRGLAVLNISNPQTPYQMSQHDTPGLAWSLAISGQALYLADDAQGLISFSLVNPVTPDTMGLFRNPGEVVSVWVEGSYAYTARGFQGKITIQDVTDPILPETISQVEFRNDVVEIRVRDNICYSAQLTGGIAYTNVTDPEYPQPLGRSNTEGEARDMIPQLPIIYVADGSEGLVFLSSNPDSAWQLLTDGWARSLLMRSDTMYVSQWDAGVALVDVSSPTQPQLLAQYDTPGLAHHLAVFGDYIYVADDLAGLTILHNGILAGNYPTPGPVWDVQVSGDHAYLAAGSAGLIILDMTDPLDPVYAGSYQTPGFAQRIFLDGGSIYVACQFCLGIYRFLPTGVSPENPLVPSSFDLTIHPNPFNAVTVVNFELRVPSLVNLNVYDLSGRLVATLVNGFLEAGFHQATFNGKNLPSGLYFVQMRAGEYSAVRKMALVK